MFLMGFCVLIYCAKHLRFNFSKFSNSGKLGKLGKYIAFSQLLGGEFRVIR